MSALDQARDWAKAHQEEQAREGGVHLCDRTCLVEAWMSGATAASEENRITVAQAIAGTVSERRTRERDL